MGNQLRKEYDVQEAQSASGGPGSLWKVYQAHKKSTKEPVSIFVFDRKHFSDKNSRKNAEVVSNHMRKEMQTLMKLRHPKILSVHQVFDDSRLQAMVTEPVFCSLGNALGDYRNFNAGEVPRDLEKFTLSDLDKKSGLVSVFQAFEFLHETANVIHLNICPASIFLTKETLTWKIAGFNFCQYSQYQSGEVSRMDWREHDGGQRALSVPVQPMLSYLAPEAIYDKAVGFPSDLFSLGCLIYEVYAEKEAFPCQGNVLSYKQMLEKSAVHGLDLTNVPDTLHGHLKLLLSRDPESRVRPGDLLAGSHFDDVLLHTLHYLDTIDEKDDASKGRFLKGLNTVLPRFSHNVLIHKVLPPLLKELTKSPVLVPFLLSAVIKISKDLEKPDFVTRVQPSLLPIMTLREPVQARILLVTNVELLLNQCSGDVVSKNVMKMLIDALEMPAEVQAAVLKLLPSYAPKIDYVTLKTELLPRVIKAVLATTVLGVRVNGLICLSKIVGLVDSEDVRNEIVNAMITLTKVDKSPAVLMAVLGVFDTLSKKSTPEFIAVNIIPRVMPLSIEPHLNEKQFHTYMTIVREFIRRVEVSRASEFQRVRELQSTLTAKTQGGVGMGGANDSFEGLVANGYRSTSTSSTSPNAKPKSSASSIPEPDFSSVSPAAAASASASAPAASSMPPAPPKPSVLSADGGSSRKPSAAAATPALAGAIDTEEAAWDWLADDTTSSTTSSMKAKPQDNHTHRRPNAPRNPKPRPKTKTKSQPQPQSQSQSQSQPAPNTAAAAGSPMSTVSSTAGSNPFNVDWDDASTSTAPAASADPWGELMALDAQATTTTSAPTANDDSTGNGWNFPDISQTQPQPQAPQALHAIPPPKSTTSVQMSMNQGQRQNQSQPGEYVLTAEDLEITPVSSAGLDLDAFGFNKPKPKPAGAAGAPNQMQMPMSGSTFPTANTVNTAGGAGVPDAFGLGLGGQAAHATAPVNNRMPMPMPMSMQMPNNNNNASMSANADAFDFSGFDSFNTNTQSQSQHVKKKPAGGGGDLIDFDF